MVLRPTSRPLCVAAVLVTLLLALVLAGDVTRSHGAELSAVSTENAAQPRNDRYRGKQLLLSRDQHGRPLSAPAEQPAISQDNRTAVAAAYVSRAEGITPLATGGHQNVYLVHRRKGYDKKAKKPWLIGRVVMASRGTEVPDGDSWAPAFDGDDNHRASCLAFLSTATNLTAGDGNGRADAFVRNLRNGKIRRINTSGTANSVSVDGGCKRVLVGTDRGVFLSTNGRRARRIAGGVVSDVSISTYGKTASWLRAGNVRLWRSGKRVGTIGRGSAPQIAANGKLVVYERGGKLKRYLLKTRRTATVGNGSQAAMTLTGRFTFWVSGSLVRAVGLKKPVAHCSGGPGSPATSAHGNYVLYTCPPGEAVSPHPQVYLGHIGSSSYGKR